MSTNPRAINYQRPIRGPLFRNARNRNLFRNIGNINALPLARAPYARRARPGMSNYSKVQGNQGVEAKFVDTALSMECSTTGAIVLLNSIGQGDDFTQRIGRKVNIKSLLLRGHMKVGATATSACLRLVVVYDKQTNGVAPAITDVLTGATMEACTNLNNKDRFVIILDKQFNVEITDASDKPWKKYVKVSLEEVFSGTATGVANIATGGLFILSMGDLATGVAAPIFTLTSRIRFTDD